MAWIIATDNPDPAADHPTLIGPFPDAETATAYAEGKGLNDRMAFDDPQCPCQLLPLTAPFVTIITDADDALPAGWVTALPPGATE